MSPCNAINIRLDSDGIRPRKLSSTVVYLAFAAAICGLTNAIQRYAQLRGEFILPLLLLLLLLLLLQQKVRDRRYALDSLFVKVKEYSESNTQQTNTHL